MEISAVTSSSNPVNSIFATTRSQRVEFSIVTPVATSSTSVDISALGQLLSATSILNKTLGATNSTASFGTVVAVTQQLVDAFNAFLQSQQTTSGISIGSLFEQMLSASGSSGAGTSVFNRLSGVGVDFQAATSQDVPAQMTIDFQQLQAAYTTDQAGTVATLLAASQSIGQLAAQLASAVSQADMLTQLGTLQAEASNTAGAVSSMAGTSTTVSGAAVSGTVVSGTTGTNTSVSGAAVSGTTGTNTSVSGAAVSGTTGTNTSVSGAAVSGTTGANTSVSGTTVSGTTGANTSISGTTVSGTAGTEVSGTTESGTTVSGTTSSATTVSGTAVSSTAGTVIGATVSGTPGASASVEAGTTVLSAASPGTVATATSATIDTTLAAEAVAQTVVLPVLLTLPALAETPVLLTGTVLPTTQNAVVQPSVAAIARSSTLINPLIDSSNPAIAAAIAAYHMVDGIFDTAWPHDGGAPPPINYSEIRAVAGIGRIKLDLTA